MAFTLIVRDQYGVHPDDRQFVEKKTQEILEQYDHFHLLHKKLLQQVWVIGTLLFQLKEKVFDGQWQNFCREHFKVSLPRIRIYMQLAANRPRLEEHFKTLVNERSDNLPGIEEAIAIVRSWTNKRKKTGSSRKVSLKEYCPTCGRVMTKSAKTWMKRHSEKQITT